MADLKQGKAVQGKETYGKGKKRHYSFQLGVRGGRRGEASIAGTQEKGVDWEKKIELKSE